MPKYRLEEHLGKETRTIIDNAPKCRALAALKRFRVGDLPRLRWISMDDEGIVFNRSTIDIEFLDAL